MNNSVFEVQQFWINALTHAGSSCQRCRGELQQIIKVSGSAGQNKHNKMHVSTEHKSVTRYQHINLELQPWWHYYEREREGKSRGYDLKHQSDLTPTK